MNVKQALMLIDNLTETGLDPLETKKLWNVLAAMRGPDNGDETLKFDTTAVIRYHALPRIARLGGAIISPREYVLLRHSLNPEHFEYHIQQAAYALELPIKDGVNSVNRYYTNELRL